MAPFPPSSSADKPAARSRLSLYTCLGLGMLLLIVLSPHLPALYTAMINFVAQVESPYQRWLEQRDTSNPFILMGVSFGGGLLASISPCILSLLPVNLSYIGTLEMRSRREAIVKASLFVLGVVTLFSLVGLFASFAAAVLVEYRGIIHLVVGSIIFLMGLSLAGIIYLPLPKVPPAINFAGPYGVGLTFALVSSPCSSPVLFAVLAAAAATGSQWVSTLALVSYGLGYTAIIFLASVFTGLVKQSRSLLQHSDWIVRIGSSLLILAGLYYLIGGIRWFL